jgi:hypothetical protein
VARQYDGQVEVIGVAGRDSTEAMADFVARHELDGVPQIDDADGSIWARFGIAGQPAWVFIDGETGQQERLLGALGPDGLTERIEELLASESAAR